MVRQHKLTTEKSRDLTYVSRAQPCPHHQPSPSLVFAFPVWESPGSWFSLSKQVSFWTQSVEICLPLLVQSKSLWLPLTNPSHHWVIGMQHALWPGLIPCHLECSVGREGEVQRGYVAGEGNGINAEMQRCRGLSSML